MVTLKLKPLLNTSPKKAFYLPKIYGVFRKTL